MSGSRGGRHPVRVAFWLVVACVVVNLVDLLTSLAVLRHFDLARLGNGPWDDGTAQELSVARSRLVAGIVLAVGLSAVLSATATAVPRRTAYTRGLCSWTLGFVALVLIVGVIYSPDSITAEAASTEWLVTQLQPLIPLWFSAVHGCVVVATIVLAAAAVLRLAREEAGEYYRQRDPTATWRGFISWIEVGSR